MNNFNAGTMEAREGLNQRVADLYRLAFLITGDIELSIDLAAETVAWHETPDFSFAGGISKAAKRLVIAEALAAMGADLAASAHRTQARDAAEPEFPRRDWTLNPATTKAELEQALRSIDVFPRCVLLLCVFEGLSQKEAAIFLDCDRELVRKAQVIGLWELTRNLAIAQGWAPARRDATSFGITAALRYA